MTFNFVRQYPPFCTQIEHYITEAIKKSTLPLNLDLNDIKNLIKSDNYCLFSVYDDKVITGFFLYSLSEIKSKKHMNLILLDGVKTLKWFPVMAEYLRKTFDSLGIDEFTLIGRPGWKKLFPQLSVAGVIYRVAKL